NGNKRRAVVCRAGGQQMVYARCRCVGSYRNPRLTRPGVSQSGRRKTQGTRRSEEEVAEQVTSGAAQWFGPHAECEGGSLLLTTAQVMLATLRLFSNRRQWRACERQSNSQSPATPLLLPTS